MEKIRIGIFGLRRGSNFFESVAACNGEVVAVCDNDKQQYREVKNNLPANVTYYDDFESFLTHPMDAVLLANFFN